eukprot:403372231
MGNIDSRAKFDCGHFIVQTDQPFYSPGEVATARIYMRINRPVDATHIDLEIKGKEKASFLVQMSRQIQDGDQVRHETYWEKKKARKELLDAKQPVFVFPGGNLLPGDYVIPIQFTLPKNIPSSMFFKNKHSQRKPKAQVKYTICCKMQTRSDKHEMKYKQVLIIRENPPSFQGGIAGFQSNKLTTWCCVDQGISKIDVTFDKNTFFPNEKAHSKVTLDNSKCNLNMKNVRMAVEQNIHIQAEGFTFADTITLVQKQEGGVHAKQDNKVDKELEVDLNSIRYPAPETKKKHGKVVPVSLEDAFQMSQMQPACHGHLVRNEYFIAVRTDFEGCTCCTTFPSVKTPLVVLPIVNPQCFGFAAPPDFHPQTQQVAHISIITENIKKAPKHH